MVDDVYGVMVLKLVLLLFEIGEGQVGDISLGRYIKILN